MTGKGCLGGRDQCTAGGHFSVENQNGAQLAGTAPTKKTERSNPPFSTTQSLDFHHEYRLAVRAA